MRVIFIFARIFGLTHAHTQWLMLLLYCTSRFEACCTDYFVNICWGIRWFFLVVITLFGVYIVLNCKSWVITRVLCCAARWYEFSFYVTSNSKVELKNTVYEASFELCHWKLQLNVKFGHFTNVNDLWSDKLNELNKNQIHIIWKRGFSQIFTFYFMI